MEQSLIDKDKLVESMVWRDDQGMISSIDDILDTIENEPTIDPESLRPTAYWECLGEAEALQFGSTYAASYCSRCKVRVRCRSNYCPHCGAKMEDESDGDVRCR